MKEVANGETGLHYVWKDLAVEIEDRISSAQINNDGIKIIQQYLVAQLSKNGKFDNAIDFTLLRYLLQEDGFLLKTSLTKPESVTDNW